MSDSPTPIPSVSSASAVPPEAGPSHPHSAFKIRPGAGARPAETPPAAAWRRALPHHLVAFILFAAGLYFVAWFLASNPVLWLKPRFGGVFWSLLRPFVFENGEMDFRMLGWSIGAVSVFTVIGWYAIESLDLYLPRIAAAALAYTAGLGLAGFLFELLAMAGWLNRAAVLLACIALLLIFAPLAWLAAERRPEAWKGGEGGAAEHAMRRRMARRHYWGTLTRPSGIGEWTFLAACLFLIASITFLTFYHALLFPEAYWDSMILYLGYARMMFYNQGIVRKVVGQVGIGLGANYPHLYSLLGAGVCSAAGEWSELPQRLMAPLAGLASTTLVFSIILRLSRHVNFALAMTLLYRSIPLGTAYDYYAADYSIAILFTAAFLYAALIYIETGLSGGFILATALAALSLHVNYLMGILVVPWGVMIIGAHWRMFSAADELRAERDEGLGPGRPEPLTLAGAVDDEGGASPTEPAPTEPPPSWTRHHVRVPVASFLSSPFFIMATAACAAVGSTWFLRNWIVTGNPVYAFFHKIFGGENINQEVMESAAREWAGNGAGIAMFGETLPARIRGGWESFVDWRQAYRIQPFFTGFACMGALVLVGRAGGAIVAGLRARADEGRPESGWDSRAARGVDIPLRLGLAALGLAGAMLAYHFVLAPFYLYQIIMMTVPLAVVASFAFPYWRMRGWRCLFGALALVTGLVPGLAMSLMGFKFTREVAVGVVQPDGSLAYHMEGQGHLFALRHPLPRPETFYAWQYGDDARMFEFINRNLRGKRILTHENRHLAFDPSIELVHLDDWLMQQLWPRRPEDKVAELNRLGIHYYLYVPNEDNHTVNAHMGAQQWAPVGLAEVVYRAGKNVLFKLGG